MRDLIYAEQKNEIEKFEFNKEVADVFSDMIKRSVPGYEFSLSMIKVLARRFGQTDSNCYDFGCSLGAVSLALKSGIDKENCKIIAVDNSDAMIEKCRKNLDFDNIEIICDDILNIEIRDASIVVLNFTLQFIPKEKRKELLSKIYKALLPGGILVVSEKITFEDREEQKFLDELHSGFKKVNGYSELEMEQKRNALDNVLVPENINDHYERLKDIGFDNVYMLFRCLNFCSIAAKKAEKDD